VAAFVIFESQEGKERAEKYWNCATNLFGYVQENEEKKNFELLNEDLELNGEIPEPSNYIWKNLLTEPLTILRNQIIAYSLIFFILFGILISFIYVKKKIFEINHKYQTGNDCSSYKDFKNLEEFKTVALHDKDMIEKNHGLGTYVCYCI